jgi:hypothetical protein
MGCTEKPESGLFPGVRWRSCDPDVDNQYEPACVPCPAGSSSDSLTDLPCDACLAGKAQAATGSAECDDCPGEVTQEESVGLADCPTVCAPGEGWVPGEQIQDMSDLCACDIDGIIDGLDSAVFATCAKHYPDSDTV